MKPMAAKKQREMKFVEEVDSAVDIAMRAKFAAWGKMGGKKNTKAQQEARKRSGAALAEWKRKNAKKRSG